MPRETWERLTMGTHTPERCIEAAFRFLLDREPKESILRRFDITVISRYFPEFERELPRPILKSPRGRSGTIGRAGRERGRYRGSRVYPTADLGRVAARYEQSVAQLRYVEWRRRALSEDVIIAWSLAQNHQPTVEVAMKYVLLGNLSPEWASKQSERVGKAKAKLDKLGIKVESIHYTQGYYDFVDIVDAPSPEAMLAFSVWYSTQGLGRIQSMPAFDAKTFETAIKSATG